MMKTKFARRLSFLIILVLCAGTLYAQQKEKKKREEFLAAISMTVEPIAGNEGQLLKSAEAKYTELFKDRAFQGASFDTYFFSDDVGGILVRNQPVNPKDTLKLDSVTFKLDESKTPPVVQFRIKVGGHETALTVEASLVSVAARLATDEKDQLALLTLAARSGRTERSGTREAETMVDKFAFHPALTGHRLAIQATVVDDSLRTVMDGTATHYIISESEWRLSANSFNNKQPLFKVECRVRDQKLNRPSLRNNWLRNLNPTQQAAVRQLNDFFAVYRLINAATEGHLEGFPEADFVTFLKQIQPQYKAQAVTLEEEQSFHQWLKAR